METPSANNQAATPFSPNTYTIKLGESFKPGKSSKRNRKSSSSSSGSNRSSDGPQYYSYKFTSSIDPHLSERKATLEKVENDQYIAEWAPREGTRDSTEIVYDAMASDVQEVDCLLIFDEETQTFMLERPAMKFTLKKSRRKRALTTSQMALPEPLPAGTKRQRKEPMQAAPAVVHGPMAVSEQQQQQLEHYPAEQRRSSVDDQDLFSKEVDEAWDEVFVGMDDDDEEDEEDGRQQQEGSDADVFEEVVVHPSAVSGPVGPQRRSAAAAAARTPPPVGAGAKSHKHKPHLASEPILRLDIEDPRSRREHSGKTLSPRMLQQRQQQQQQKRKKTSVSSDEDDDGSSTGSSSSGSGSSSGSDSGSSSGSDSEDSNSSDDDIDDLAADISRDLASSQPSAPGSPAYGMSNTPRAFENSPYGSSASPAAAVAAAAAAAAVRHTPTGRNNGPMSLRALFDDAEQAEEDEGITSSESDSDG